MTEMRYLDLHGERVAYRDEGAGEALLLIMAWREVRRHGGQSSPVVEEVSGGGTGPVGAR